MQKPFRSNTYRKDHQQEDRKNCFYVSKNPQILYFSSANVKYPETWLQILHQPHFAVQ